MSLYKKTFLILVLLSISFLPSLVVDLFANPSKKNLKDEQQLYSRVRAARDVKEASIKSMFREKGVPYPPEGVLLIAYKMEKTLELWTSSQVSGKYIKLRSYPICALSGSLGPKRCEGDLQIPEGFYKIILYNPVSNFHLSMMINYPNESDRKLGCKRPGGTIFIHGNCVTIGCIPITDDMIKELYLICIDTESMTRRKIPVYIFPARLTDRNMKELSTQYMDNPDIIRFWNNLKTGYDIFEKTRKPLKTSTDKSGLYLFEKEP